MITNEEVSEFIYSIEKEFPVSTWRINGIDIWPIIRVKLQTKIRVSTNNTLSRKTSTYSSYTQFSAVQKIKQLFASYFRFYKLKKVDFVATSNFSHRSIFRGEFYNKFYDPILNEVNNKGIILEHNSKEFYQKKPIHNKNKVVFFEDYSYYLDLVYSNLKRFNFINPIKKIELEGYEAFLKKLNTIEGVGKLSDEFEIKKLESIIFTLFIYKKVYLKILKKTKPNFTFQICHYNTNSIALSLASKELNIPSVEIQHGGQPPVHMAYSNWLNVPKNGYNTLPKIYWNWNIESQKSLQQWTSKNDFHQAIVLGNPWTDFVKKQLINQEKKYILYSLQPVKFELIFPEYLLNFIRKNTNFKWWFRIHPTDINRKEEYLAFFEKEKINDLIIFDDGSNESLPETLSQSLLHITYSSGVAIEAIEFGVKTIFLDINASQDHYGSLIANQDAFVVEEDFEKLVKTVIALKTNIPQSSIDYTTCFEVLKN